MTNYTTEVTESIRKPQIRTVYVTFPHVGENGTPYHFEMTSFQGGPVEVYWKSSEGIYMYQGSVKDYAPGSTDLQEAFRKVWLQEQPSKEALASFEVSAKNSYREAVALMKEGT